MFTIVDTSPRGMSCTTCPSAPAIPTSLRRLALPPLLLPTPQSPWRWVHPGGQWALCSRKECRCSVPAWSPKQEDH